MHDVLDLWDWRRTVAALYAEMRALPPEAAWRRWCEVRARLFREHPQSPLEDRAAGAPHMFGYDPAFRIPVRLDPVDAPPFAVPAGADGDVILAPFARTAGLASRLGGELTLYWIEAYGGGVILPFADSTSGTETYGGGRYLLDTVKGADPVATTGAVELDFNLAYNPSCAYSPRWTCPLAPRENRLPTPIPAGERHPKPH